MSKKLLTVLMSTSLILSACGTGDSVSKSKSVKDIQSSETDTSENDIYVESNKKNEELFLNELEYYSDLEKLIKDDSGKDGTLIKNREILKENKIIDTKHEEYRYRFNKDGKFYGGKVSLILENEELKDFSLKWYDDKSGKKFDYSKIKINKETPKEEKIDKNKEDMKKLALNSYIETKDSFLKKYDVYKKSFKAFEKQEQNKFYLYWNEKKNDESGEFHVDFSPIYTDDSELVAVWNEKNNKKVLLDHLSDEEIDSAQITSIVVGTNVEKPEESNKEKDMYISFGIDVYYTDAEGKENAIKENIKLFAFPGVYDIDENGESGMGKNIKFGKPSTETFTSYSAQLKDSVYGITS